MGQHINTSWPPGPSVVSRLRAGSFFSIDSPTFYRQNAARFGDVLSFRTPNGFRQFQFNHPDDIADVLVQDARHHLRGVVLRRARGILGEGLLTSEDPLHLRHRRLAQPAFHRNRIAAYGETIVALTTQLTRTWQPHQPIPLHAEMVRLTLRIISHCLLGCDVDDRIQTFVDSMQTFNKYLPFALLPGASLLERLPIGPIPGMRRSLAALDEVIYAIIRTRRTTTPGNDLLGMLLESTDEQGGLTECEVRDEALTMLLAGHETTANALTFTLWLAARHPEIQQRIADEVAAVCGPNPPRSEHCPRLLYTEQVFAESMRLYPPAWVVARTAKEPYTMRNGQFIPKGAHLILSQLVVHHDPRWWPDPLRFDPDRFTPEAKAIRPKFAYFPFGGGARFCIGDRFAWMEGVLMLATVVQSWHLEAPPGTPAELPITHNFTIRPTGEPLILTRPR